MDLLPMLTELMVAAATIFKFLLPVKAYKATTCFHIFFKDCSLKKFTN